MNIRTEKIESGEEEIIIRYREMTDEISNVIDYLNRADKSIAGHKGKELFLLKYGDILYFECVDNVVFAYTDSEAYQIYFSLTELEDKTKSMSFFRCNKSFIVNIKKITVLRSNLGNRIDATLKNGEHIVISRHYAKRLREILKGGEEDE